MELELVMIQRYIKPNQMRKSKSLSVKQQETSERKWDCLMA